MVFTSAACVGHDITKQAAVIGLQLLECLCAPVARVYVNSD
jgi:hypothetical protein